MEDQTLNPFRAPIVAGKVPRRVGTIETEPAKAPPIRLLRELPICLLLGALILVAYCSVWHFDFVYFDDPGYVKDNLNVVRGLPLFTDFKGFCASVNWAFTAFEQSNWHPLTWLSHMLDVQIYGLWAGGHHITNIILHISNTVLLFWLLRMMTGRVWPSAAVAALFAVHPMHVESVVWVAERKDMLSTFLGLLTLIAYVRYSRKAVLANDTIVVVGVLAALTWLMALLLLGSIRSGHPENFPASMLWVYALLFAGVLVYGIMSGRYNLMLYCLIFVLFALGLLAKPMLITLPFLCLLMDFWPLGRFGLMKTAEPQQAALAERTAAPRRKAKRNQRLPARRASIATETGVDGSWVRQLLLLGLEKLPLLALSAASAVITPYAQNHGGSMASTDELPISFRLQNSMQSYAGYIGRLFWPGKMMSLHLLVQDEHGRPFVEPGMVAMSVAVMLVLTAVAIVAFFYGRRYVAFGWLWYVGTLVPVIGFVQVGEQAMADRYTYIPYIGLFVAMVWAVADVLKNLPDLRRVLAPAVALALAGILGCWSTWTNYQIQTWRDVQTHLLHALDVEPNNWNMLNNYGVFLWKAAQDEDVNAAKADADGDTKSAEDFRQKSVGLKKQAKDTWIHGITSRPTATDIWSNLGYAYSEAGDLDKAEECLVKAVNLKPISPRPRNNLGRVLLRRSQQLETDARTADTKGQTDPAEAAKAKQLHEAAKAKRDAAIFQFEEAVRLDPSLLEARLNLGEVFMTMNEFDKSELHYQEILKLDSKSVTDRETIGNFSQAYFGLARIALARKNIDEAITLLQQALARNPKNVGAINLLATQLFVRDEFRQGESCLMPLLAMLPRAQRRAAGEGFGKQFEGAGKIKEAVRAFNFIGWVFATCPDPHLLDPEAAMAFAKHAVDITKQQDARSLDTLAAALAINGKFGDAVQYAQTAISLANSQGDKPLAAAIAPRLQSYQQGKPYQCQLDGSDRP